MCQSIEELLSLHQDVYKSVDKGCWLFGASAYGERILNLLNNNGIKVIGFIDNSPAKCGLKINDVNVYSFRYFLKEQKCGIVIICALNPENIKEIRAQLCDSGINESDIFIYHDFLDYLLPEYCWIRQKRLAVRVVQISLTERCTLRCKKCAHACNLVKNDREDLKYEEVVKGVDEFFRIVDYIEEFVLLGGEPLLYKKLRNVIDYIGSKYRNKIGVFSITTNGTLVPDDMLLKSSKKYNVKFRISDYSKTVNQCKKTLVNIEKMLKKHSIEYDIEKVYWVDFGFDWKDRGNDPIVLKDVFRKCKTPCRELRFSRLYYCMMGRSVAENMSYNVGENDYLDLIEIQNTQSGGKFEYLKYTLGFLDKGYIDMCRHCNANEAFLYPIVPAEQM